MGKKVPVEDLVVPPQNTKICGTICICQMTLVLSSVALVYLTVAVYAPSNKAFKSGVIDVPVMCTTTRAIMDEGMDENVVQWCSCGEWCLSKTSGACMQIYVNLRHNGTNLLFSNCTNSANKTCYGIDQDNAKKSRCIADECKNLTGTFNCTAGMCTNITDAFECIFKNTDPALKCSGRRGKITCSDISGLFSCTKGTCKKIRTPYNCDRRCVDIPTRNKNMILMSGDKVFLSQCQSAINNDTQEEVWTETEDNVAITSCYNIRNTTLGIEATDCINGSVLEKSALNDSTNFTYLSYLHAIVSKPVKSLGLLDLDLTIYNESKLFINMEGCVNTLRDECKEFLKEYGKDGTDHNARARFPCFYSEKKKEEALARFDLNKTYKQFLFASTVPSVLFVVSCVILVLCQRTVTVGDDARMRFKGCSPKENLIKSMSKGSQGTLADAGGGDGVMAL